MTSDEADDVLEALQEPTADLAKLLDLREVTVPNHRELIQRAHEATVKVTISTAEEMINNRMLVQRLEDEVSSLDALSRRDPLTTLANRRAVEEFIEVHLASRRRHGLEGAFAIVMIDIDHFKSVNDTYGHAVGDQVLRMVAAQLQNVARSDELLGRIGGEEFVVVAPITDESTLLRMGTRLREAVEQGDVPTAAGPIGVTISIGVAASQSVSTVEDVAALYRRADAALYEAKANGRNRVEVAA